MFHAAAETSATGGGSGAVRARESIIGGGGAPPSSKTVAGRDEVNRQDHKLGRRCGHFLPSAAGGDSFAGAGAGAVGGDARAGAADPESRGLWVSAKSASISF